MAEIYREAAGVRTILPHRAALMKFDAYVASDFMWATLPRGTCRIQMFHGVGGKYGFDAPTESMREWHRLFFVNERRLQNYVAAGAIDRDSPAIRLIGMPKVDCLVDGTLDRDAVLPALGLDPSPSDGPVRADLVARLVAQRDRRRARRRPAADADQPDRQAARPIARPARAVLGRRRLGGASAAAPRDRTRRDRARRTTSPRTSSPPT